ncbi:MAG: hypothetical protein AAGI11_14930 [Pseudomonadota bacterium]
MLIDRLDSVPIILIIILTVVVVLAAIEIGFRIGRWRRDVSTGLAESEAQLSAMTGAHLALLAFIMAFSFSMAAGHYQERRALIMEDVNAISTAYLRAELIGGEDGEVIRKALYQYTVARAEVGDLEQAPAMIRESERLQMEIWQQIQSLINNNQVTIIHSLLIQSVNEVFDIHEARLAAGLKNRVPRVLWAILAGLLTLAMLGIGYFSGAKGSRNPIASTGLALSFSLVLIMIADLDRPAGGSVRADQGPMIALRDKLSADFGQ